MSEFFGIYIAMALFIGIPFVMFIYGTVCAVKVIYLIIWNYAHPGRSYDIERAIANGAGYEDLKGIFREEWLAKYF